jgi:hypothetical protein
MAVIALNDLRHHVPGLDCGRLVACSCGWRLSEPTDDLWISWIDHLAEAQGPPVLRLTTADREWLRGVHIMVKEAADA